MTDVRMLKGPRATRETSTMTRSTCAERARDFVDFDQILSHDGVLGLQAANHSLVSDGVFRRLGERPRAQRPPACSESHHGPKVEDEVAEPVGEGVDEQLRGEEHREDGVERLEGLWCAHAHHAQARTGVTRASTCARTHAHTSAQVLAHARVHTHACAYACRAQAHRDRMRTPCRRCFVDMNTVQAIVT